MGAAADGDVAPAVAGTTFAALFQTGDPAACAGAGFRLVNVGDNGPQCLKPKDGMALLASRLETRQVRPGRKRKEMGEGIREMGTGERRLVRRAGGGLVPIAAGEWGVIMAGRRHCCARLAAIYGAIRVRAARCLR